MSLPIALRDPVRLVALAGGVAALAWGAWLLSLAQTDCWGAGPHLGCPRVDFSAFWGAGRLADAGRGADAYGWPALRAELERNFGVGGIAPLPFLYPPPMLLAASGLGALPYPAAFRAWTVLGLAAYASAAWAVLRRLAAWGVACAPAGVFFCAFAGQTGFLTAAAMASGLLCLERRPRLAGVLFGLVACKPQLALLVPVALVAGGRWRTLASAAAMSALLWAASAAAFGQAVVTGFLHGAAGGGGDFAGGGWLPWWKVQSLYGALRAAGLPALPALGLQAVLAAAASGWVWTVWRGGASPGLEAATLAAATLTVSPYGFVYEGPTLAVAALFLLRDTRLVPLAPAEAVLLAAGLFGQATFMFAPGPLVTPVAALALLAAAGLRIVRRPAADALPYGVAPSTAPVGASAS